MTTTLFYWVDRKLSIENSYLYILLSGLEFCELCYIWLSTLATQYVYEVRTKGFVKNDLL